MAGLVQKGARSVAENEVQLTRHIKEAQAHLIPRALAPSHIARRQLLAIHDRLLGRRVVPMALDGQRIARAKDLRGREGHAALPVEIPAGDIEEAFVLPTRVLNRKLAVRSEQMLMQ